MFMLGEKIMSNVLNDANIARQIMKGYHLSTGIDKNHNRIYFSSNEKLDSVFSGIDFTNKDVLSVLASGDQMFHFYDRGAKNVDTFDINVLTKYYYYLRKWVIEYKNRFYPKRKINKNYIKGIVSCVKAKTEEEKDALIFWNYLLESSYDISNLFVFDRDLKKNRLSKLKHLRKIVGEKNIVFHNIDLSSQIDIDKKYDIIYKSNISDYVNGSEKVLSVFRDNLYNLLNDDGIIISSNLCYDYCYANEFGVFGSLFNYELLNNGKGFIYRKRR